MAVPERLAPVAGRLQLNRFTREGLDALSCGLGERFFVDASQHPSTKLFPVWKTFSSRFKKVSTRNASAKKLSSVLRVNARLWCTVNTFTTDARRHGVERFTKPFRSIHPTRESA